MKYIVKGDMTTFCTVEVEADSKEEAWAKAELIDMNNWTLHNTEAQMCDVSDVEEASC